ncbi:MAG: hypothetical protein K2I76_01390 [Malacoplasma sp.]|nr:hypothetical protein [Malacoplasma sp.]MDE6562688.1 hypothetical protein [Malacoplasma sp.]
MIFFNFNQLVREKIESLNNNEFWKLFSNKDNKSIFYTGIEKKIDELDFNKFIEHTKTFFPKSMDKIKSEFVKTKIPKKDKGESLLSFVVLGKILSVNYDKKSYSDVMKIIYSQDLSNDNEKYVFIIYPYKIENFHD